tara:strand:- start:1831 stop:2211 length:381 start_codon:yes stop_codon:yes gene_type:complete
MNFINKTFIYFISFICFLFAENIETKDSTNTMLNHDWKSNLMSIGHGMPNIGQFENNKPYKALSLMIMKYYWLNEYKSSKINENISERNRSFWWLFILNFYGIVDAYVDYHLKDFPKEKIENGEKE